VLGLCAAAVPPGFRGAGKAANEEEAECVEQNKGVALMRAPTGAQAAAATPGIGKAGPYRFIFFTALMGRSV